MSACPHTGNPDKCRCEEIERERVTPADTKPKYGEALRIADKFNAEPHHFNCATRHGGECDCFKSSYEVHKLAYAFKVLYDGMKEVLRLTDAMSSSFKEENEKDRG